MVIAVDFDGTVVRHEFPLVGKDIGAQKVLRRLVENGHLIVLNTMRSNGCRTIDCESENARRGDFLKDAVEWFKKNNIPLYGVNGNPSQYSWTSSPKVYADLYIDDAALGCPCIKIGGHKYVDWTTVEKLLEFEGLFDK
jgi:hypothetical protein